MAGTLAIGHSTYSTLETIFERRSLPPQPSKLYKKNIFTIPPDPLLANFKHIDDASVVLDFSETDTAELCAEDVSILS